MTSRGGSRDNLEYQPALDGLRAFAAVTIVLYHLHLPGLAGGYIGVDIFFVLSGFLITRILLKSVLVRGKVDFRRFYLRRALRLLPAYFAVVGTAVIADHFINVGGTLKGAVASFFYVANWAIGVMGVGLGSLHHTWSLSIEEQFYLVWPALLTAAIWFAKRKGHHLGIYVATGLLGAYAATVVATAAGGSEAFISNATPLRAVELLAGCLLASTLPSAPARGSTVHEYLGPLCLVGLLVLIIFDPFGGQAAPLVMWPLVSALTCGLIVALCRGVRMSRLFEIRPVVAVGVVSYGLYLWHFPVFASIDTTLGLRSAGPRVLALLITAVLVPFSYFVIERPFLRLKSRLEPRNVATPVAPEDDSLGNQGALESRNMGVNRV